MRTLCMAGLVLGAVSGCGLLEVPPQPPFELGVFVDSDPGSPLADAAIWKGGKEGPHTGPDGKVTLKLGGQEGESVDLMVRCPQGYVSPTRPITVLLRRMAAGKIAEYAARCPPLLRRLVVAVRAENGPNIPVTYFGRVLGRTDANGALTVGFQMPPGDGVELVFDTSDPTFKRMTPKMPAGSFTVKPYDDIVAFDQSFHWDAPPKPRGPKLPDRPTAIPARRGNDGQIVD